MILRYFDSTYLCKLRWPEAGSSEVADCAACADVLICCTLGRAEFYSTGHRKAREGSLTYAQLAVVFEQFNQDCAVGAVRLLPLTSAMFDRVEQSYRNAPTTIYLRLAGRSGERSMLLGFFNNGSKAIRAFRCKYEHS
jgi:hypothetical protein